MILVVMWNNVRRDKYRNIKTDSVEFHWQKRNDVAFQVAICDPLPDRFPKDRGWAREREWRRREKKAKREKKKKKKKKRESV